MKSRILAVDDERDILTLLEYTLNKEGFDVISVEDGPEALDAARESRPDLILLDIMLPRMDGTEALKELKRDDRTRGIPVVMLTAKGEEIDRVVGFELGADDYIVKPFSPKELVLRVKAILGKKNPAAGEDRVVKGPITLDRQRYAAYADGTDMGLTVTEFKLLDELVRAKGRTIGRDALMRRISSTEEHANPRTADSHVRRLRMKLGPHTDCIETVRGFGYRFDEEALGR
ncbi:MAG: response regulator [Thermodesulfobacteriota bacterium]